MPAAAATTSVWLVIAPALIAGSIGLCSALLSYLSARRSLGHAAAEAEATRAHQRQLETWRRRLDATELVWQELFALEQTGLSVERRERVVRAVVWLPEEVSRLVLAVIVEGRQVEPEKMERARLAIRKLSEVGEPEQT